MHHVSLYAFVILAGFVASTAQAAEDCTLKQLASLPLSVLPDGDMAVPVSDRRHRARNSKLVFGAPFSAILGKFADRERQQIAEYAIQGVKPVCRTAQRNVTLQVNGARHSRRHRCTAPILLQCCATRTTRRAILTLLACWDSIFFANADLELDLRNNKTEPVLTGSLRRAGRLLGEGVRGGAIHTERCKSGQFRGGDATRVANRLTVDLDAAMGDAQDGRCDRKADISVLTRSRRISRRSQPPPGWQPQFSYPFKSLFDRRHCDQQSENHHQIRDRRHCRPKTQVYQDKAFGSSCTNADGSADGRRPVAISSELTCSVYLFIAFKKTLYVTAADAKLPAPEPVKWTLTEHIQPLLDRRLPAAFVALLLSVAPALAVRIISCRRPKVSRGRYQDQLAKSVQRRSRGWSFRFAPFLDSDARLLKENSRFGIELSGGHSTYSLSSGEGFCLVHDDEQGARPAPEDGKRSRGWR